MAKEILKIKKLENFVEMPKYQTPLASAMDLYAAIEESITIRPMERILVPTGIKIELPKNTEAQIRPRSGLAIKSGITLSNCVGTIDEDYRGEICVGLINLSNQDFTILRGDRIAQMAIMPILRVEIKEAQDLSETKRQEGGFGSTGVSSGINIFPSI